MTQLHLMDGVSLIATETDEYEEVIVLCRWDKTDDHYEYVTWRLSPNGEPTSGHYFKGCPEGLSQALGDLMHRSRPELFQEYEDEYDYPPEATAHRIVKTSDEDGTTAEFDLSVEILDDGRVMLKADKTDLCNVLVERYQKSLGHNFCAVFTVNGKFTSEIDCTFFYGDSDEEQHGEWLTFDVHPTQDERRFDRMEDK